jgi:coenzyme F420-reducing hydrogenase alpha subunit
VSSNTRLIKVEGLSRIEGEGKLYIRVKEGTVEEVRLNIFEPPRFFEAFLQGRHYLEIPDMVSRICGICPVAHQMSAIHAIEKILSLEVSPATRAMRRVLYLGEWIESHALSIYMLHAPDFTGCKDAVQMAKNYPTEVQRGLKLKKVGNEILKKLGGRAVHPVNVRVGGFYRRMEIEELEPLIEQLKWAREAALETVRWTSHLMFPDYRQDYEFVALRHPDEYPLNEGRIVSTKGMDIDPSQYELHFVEEQVKHSNALHSRIRERDTYLVGPLARFNLNFDKLTPVAQQAAREAGLSVPVRNPFKNIVVRSVEVLNSVEESLQLLQAYEPPEQPYVEVEGAPRPGWGYACTEAPRGMLYHHYRLNEQGLVEEARIIPPTAQNQNIIEEDLKLFVSQNMSIPRQELTNRCEQTIRNYDPCLSCSTHFLKLEWEEV